MADVNLFGVQLQKAAQPVLKELGGTNRERLETLLKLFEIRETVPVSEVSQSLSPGASKDKAENDLKNFRTALASASQTAGVRLTFPPDPNKNADERICCFQGPSEIVREIEQRVADITRATPDNDLARGVPTRTGRMPSGKTPITLFVSYAHLDQKLKEDLLKRLDGLLRGAKEFEFSTWNDRMIELGADWNQQIKKALEVCDLGLFLASPNALASKYIRDNELGEFFGPKARKPGIPVALTDLNFKHTDLRGLEAHQIFFHETKTGEKRSFQNCRNKTEFVDRLFDQLCNKLRASHAQATAAEVEVDSKFEQDPMESSLTPEKKLAHEDIPVPETIPLFREGLANRTSTAANVLLASSDGAHVAIDELMAWASREPESVEPFLAVLGEYGIGKTTLLQAFARRLKEERSTNPALPIPVYIDLRLMSVPADGPMPSLEELFSDFIRNCWQASGTNGQSLTAEGLIQLVRGHNAILIFDGLDEKTVAMRPERAQEFLRRLWSCLPDAPVRLNRLKNQKEDSQKGNVKPVQSLTRGRMIISCRSHYFRDVTAQASMLRGEDREQIDGYPALILVPWNEETILGYLQQRLGSEEQAVKAIQLIKNVHNLRDLAERPYLLQLIAGSLRELEQAATRGETINAARLYRMITGEWLERDQGKHQISRPHKTLLMEQLALSLHREGEKSWAVDKLESWLDQFLIDHQAIERNAKVSDVRILKEDLRAATFVVRPDHIDPTSEPANADENKNKKRRKLTDGNRFQFAHTSLQEFFLASALVDSLDKEDGSAWDLPAVSRETYDFVGQLIEIASEREQERMLKTLSAVLGREPVRAAELAFRYWLRAVELNLPEPNPTAIRVPGIRLDEQSIGGTRRLNFQNADFSHATLRRAQLRNLDLSNANFAGADLAQAIVEDCDARNANWSDANLDGVKWLLGEAGPFTSAASCRGFAWRRQADGPLSVLDPDDAARYPITSGKHSGWRLKQPGHISLVRSCAFSSDNRYVISASSDNTLRLWDAQSGECLRTYNGHSNAVRSCAFSSDDRHAISASRDATLRLWDTQSSECLRTFNGHNSTVTSCAFSSDNRYVISASDDKTLRLWNAQSGECLRTYNGHSDAVRSCAISSDDRHVISASADRTLRLWDAQSGECLRTFNGHNSTVTSCAFSSDDRHVISASDDNTLRLWDTKSAECLRTFTGHADIVTTCAFSSDDRHVISASDDNTLRLWDTKSAECLRTFTGHSDAVTSCAFSSDDLHVISASDDNTLRLWDAKSGECLRTFTGYTSNVSSCEFSSDNRHVISAAWDNTVRLWDTQTGEQLRIFTGHKGPVRSCAFSSDDRHVISASVDNMLRLWDATSGECLRTFNGHTDIVNSCAFSSDNRHVISASDDNTLRLWDAQSGECLQTFTGHADIVNSCAFSSDDRHVISASTDDMLFLWDAQSGKCLRTFTGHSCTVTSCTFSSDDQLLISASVDYTLRLWDAQSGECLQTFIGHTSFVTSCKFSSDHRHVISASSDNTLRLWNVQSGECLRTFIGHTDWVTSCAFSSNNRHVISASWDNTLRLWDAQSGECLQIMSCSRLGDFAAVRPHPDGDELIALSPGAFRSFFWEKIPPNGKMPRASDR